MGVKDMGSVSKPTVPDTLSQDTKQHKDSLRSWIVCFGSFFIFLLSFGMLYSFGLVFTNLLTTFKKSRAATVWVGTMALSMTFLMGPVVGILCQQFGCRVVIFTGGLLCSLGLFVTSFVSSLFAMYVTYGALFGFGACMCYTVPYIAVARSFSKWKSVATGIITSGISIGQLVTNPLVEQFLERYEWNGTYRNFSGIFLSICIISLAFPSKDETEEIRSDVRTIRACPVKTQGGKLSYVKRALSMVDLGIWRNRYFVIVAVTSSVVFLGYFIPMLFLADYCKNLSIPLDKATTLYMAMAVASTASRVFTGFLPDRFGVEPLTICQVTLGLSGIVAVSFTLIERYEPLLALVIVCGLCDGAVNVQLPLMVLEAVGVDRMPQAFGNLIFLNSLAILAGSPLAGLISDATGSYHAAFVFGGGFVFMGAALMSFLRCLKPQTLDEYGKLQPCEILLEVDRVTVV